MKTRKLKLRKVEPYFVSVVFQVTASSDLGACRKVRRSGIVEAVGKVAIDGTQRKMTTWKVVP